MDRQQLNEYYRKKYHAEKEQRKQQNLNKYGTRTNPAQKTASIKYYQKNKEKLRPGNAESKRRNYHLKHLETNTLRAIRKLFVE
jgi:hypothetical protein